jgi:uncharacterized protein
MLIPLLFAGAFAQAAYAAQAPAAVPANEGWVTDRAGILSAEEQASLEKQLGDFQRGSGHDIAVLTLPDLKGQPIENLALEVGRAWKLGKEGKNDGALLVIAKAERQMRIEVGRGLEGSLTDSISGRIIREIITPRFRDGDYYAGISAGVKAMMDVAGGKSLPAPAGGRRGTLPVGLIFFMVLILVLWLSSRRRTGGGPPLRRSVGGPTAIPWLLLGNVLGGSGGTGGGHRGGGFGGGFGGGGGGGFGGFGGGGGFSGGGATGRW